MSTEKDSLDRRDFLKTVGATGLTLGAANSAFAAKTGSKMTGGRVIGANDRINIGVIGVGGRGAYDAQDFARFGAQNNACQIVAVCDVYEKRKRHGRREATRFHGFLDYREVLAKSDVDAVIIATPDHWHAKMALDAMDKGKDVYLEKPMVHTNDEARQLVGHGQGDQAHPAGGFADHLGRHLVEGQEGHRRRHDRPDADEPGLVSPQFHRRRMELADRQGRRAGRQGRRLHRLEHVAGLAVQAGPQARLRRRPLLPLPQVLGLLAGHRHRPLLSRDRAAEHLLGRAAVPAPR